MRPLYAAKLQDLGPDDRIRVECGACKHVGLIAATGLGLTPHTAVLDLRHCCAAKGAVQRGEPLSRSSGPTHQPKMAGIVDTRAVA
jgi:hypothetical protein